MKNETQIKITKITKLAIVLISLLVISAVFVAIYKLTEKERIQDWWHLEQEDDRIEAFLHSKENLPKESLPPMEEGQSADDYLSACLDIRKSQYIEDLHRCKSQEEKEVVTAFWRAYFAELSGLDPQVINDYLAANPKEPLAETKRAKGK